MKKLINIMLLCATFCTIFSCSDGYEGDNTGGSNNNSTTTEEGLYVGIIGFNNTTYTKHIDVLNTNTKYSYTSFIEDLSSANGTALYYSVDAGINNLCQAALPAELENVSIVTFTDGLDNFSTVMPDIINLNYTKKEYLSKVNEKLTTTKVKEKEITAYSIGIMGEDVEDEDEFKNNLKSLSTSDENIYQVDNMDDVNNAFEEIAKSLNTKSVSKSITLKISGGIDDGSQIRFTLDNVTNAINSNLYIEGNIYRSDKNFKNISCKGLNIDGNNVNINIEGGFIVITFNNVGIDNEIILENIKYWTKNSRNEWQKDSEFDPASQAETSIIRKSAAIMLVLDCSSSLGDDFEQLKFTANDFIDLLVSGESYYEEGNKAIDLGLPSGTKWASCNVGATKPEEYGDYYAWGETETKEYYYFDNYKWTDFFDDYEGDWSLRKYCITDYKTVLEPGDDVATAKWGSNWRMPTMEEMQELVDNCSWRWTSINGVNGCKVIGPNGNSIFLPAAGAHFPEELLESEEDEEYYENGILYRGFMGGYWTNSLAIDDYEDYYDESYYYDPRILFLCEDIEEIDCEYSSYNRAFGLSVRPVCK